MPSLERVYHSLPTTSKALPDLRSLLLNCLGNGRPRWDLSDDVDREAGVRSLELVPSFFLGLRLIFFFSVSQVLVTDRAEDTLKEERELELV